MAVVHDFNFTHFPSSARRDQLAVPISLNVVSPLVAIVDLCWIVLLGVAAELAYDALARSSKAELTSLGSALAVAVLYCAFAYAGRLYRAPHLLRLKWQVGRSILVWVAVFVFLASLVFLLKVGAMFSRGEMLLFFAGGIMMTSFVRLAVARACAYVISSGALPPNQVILVATTEEFATNEAFTALERYGYAVAAMIALPADQQRPTREGLLKERMREVVRHARENRIDEVLVAVPWNRPDVINQIANELRLLPVPVKLVPDTVTANVLKRPLFDLGPTQSVELQRAPLSVTQRYLKRGMDQLLSVFGVFTLLPFMAVIAAAIRLESRGPAMFLQTRVGFNGRPFGIYKFRTMHTCDNGPVVPQATRGDSRVTQLGRLLRKLSIDEIPQLFNVLRGDMSLVGPRPHALAHDNEYDRLIATYAIRHKMKPGITGWAQVNGYRGETRELSMMKQRLESDLWYIEYWSLWLDVRILLLTLARVFKSDNAY
jgi:Undecaprenyl-phosphate glucose phosphotransferase